jgi:hypothetical protein
VAYGKKNKRSGNSASTESSNKLLFVDHRRENVNDGAEFSGGTKERFRGQSSRRCSRVTRRIGAVEGTKIHPDAKKTLQDSVSLCGKIGADRNNCSLANKTEVGGGGGGKVDHGY